MLHGGFADNYAEEAEKPAEQDAINKALYKAYYTPAELIQIFHVRKPHGKIAYIGDGNEKNKDEQESERQRPNIGCRLAYDGDRGLGHCLLDRKSVV